MRNNHANSLVLLSRNLLYHFINFLFFGQTKVMCPWRVIPIQGPQPEPANKRDIIITVDAGSSQ